MKFLLPIWAGLKGRRTLLAAALVTAEPLVQSYLAGRILWSDLGHILFVSLLFAWLRSITDTPVGKKG